MRPHNITGLMANFALATWTLPLWAYGTRYGATALAHLAIPMVLAFGALCLALRFHFRHRLQSFALFMPAVSEPIEPNGFIRMLAVLLTIFNVGAAWFLTRDALALITRYGVLYLSAYSTIHLADQCWLARRRRLAATS